jgi:hypothetical protein
MSNALTVFDPKQMQVPAHLQDDAAFAPNIKSADTVPSLNYGGKIWTISANGEKTQLMKRDQDGDEVPLAVMRVIILDYNAKRGRSYYEGAYDPDKVSAPVCWSEDGVAPHPSVDAPQSSACASCEWSKKGSKIADNGKAVTACSQHRMLAVVPASKPDMEPLRLKLAITSDWDKNEEMAAQGWFAFQQYTQFLNGRGVTNTAKIVTKMRFDPSVPYPKVLFSPHDWITPEQAAAVRPRMGSPEVQALLGGTYTPAGADGVPIQATQRPAALDAAQRAAADAAVEKAAAAKAAADAAAAKAAKAAEKKAAAEAKAKAEAEAAAAAAKKPTATVVDDDDDGDTPLTATTPAKQPSAAAQVAKAATPAAAGVPADVAAVLADWGDE